MRLDDFTTAYIEAALWSSMDNSDENTGGDPLDKNYDADDLAPDTRAKMIEDCERFQRLYGWELEHATCTRGSGGYTQRAQAGHDFWLTRNGHGAGFWDGDWSEPQATTLTTGAKLFGEFDLIVGDDGQIHH